MATIIFVGKTASGAIEKEINSRLVGSPHRTFQFHDASVGYESKSSKRFALLETRDFPTQVKTHVRYTAFPAPRIMVALEPFIRGESKTAVYTEKGELFERKCEHCCSDWCVFGDIWHEITKVLPDLKSEAPA